MFDRIVIGFVMTIGHVPTLAVAVAIAVSGGMLYGAYKLLSWIIPLLYHLF